MKIIAFLNKKGGCGKSTMICALALYWAHRGNKRVAVQDMEVDGLSSTFVEHTGHPNLTLYEDGQDYDYVLIDAEGNLSDEELAEIEAHSDQIIIPIKITPADIAKTYQTSLLVSDPKKARILFNLVRTNTVAWRNREKAMTDVKIRRLKNFVKLRSAYEYMLVDGWSALAQDGEAVRELEKLAKELK